MRIILGCDINRAAIPSLGRIALSIIHQHVGDRAQNSRTKIRVGLYVPIQVEQGGKAVKFRSGRTKRFAHAAMPSSAMFVMTSFQSAPGSRGIATRTARPSPS